MIRQKGWTHAYNKMNREEVRTELRRIERATYVHDKECKMAYLASLPKVRIAEGVMNMRPGGITMVSRSYATFV